MNKHTSTSALPTLITFLATKCLSFFKVSFVVGSRSVFLTGSGMVLPLLGLFGGVFESSLIISASLLIRYLFFGISSLSVLAFYVPGWCAALYFASHHWFIRCFLPLTCIVAFSMHPVAGTSWLYSMYWLIPVIFYFMKPKHLFYEALGATFIAHAVGSIIWLYTVPMTADMWFSLIPVVAFERLMYAAGMVVMYHVINAVHVFVIRCVKKSSFLSIHSFLE